MADQADTQTKTAAAEEAPQLPPLYTSLSPLSAARHGDLCFQPTGDFSFAAGINAVPLTAEEFPLAQRHFPIMFTNGDLVQPLALLGLRDGQNLFVGEDGKWAEGVYIPAYIRRYPFILVRIGDNDERLTLCIDEGAAGVSRGAGEGQLFDDKKQGTQLVKDVLDFCEKVDQAAARTRAFCQKVKEKNMLIEGDAVLEGLEKPIRFTGLTSISDKAVQDMNDKEIAEMARSNFLPVLYAHLFSLSTMRDLLQRAALRNAAAN